MVLTDEMTILAESTHASTFLTPTWWKDALLISIGTMRYGVGIQYLFKNRAVNTNVVIEERYHN